MRPQRKAQKSDRPFELHRAITRAKATVASHNMQSPVLSAEREQSRADVRAASGSMLDC